MKIVLNSGFNLGLLRKNQYKRLFNVIQADLNADRLLLVKLMHGQKFVFGKIPNPVFIHGVFKYVEPFELSTERLLEKDEQSDW